MTHCRRTLRCKEVSRLYGIPVIAIANLNDLFECLSGANAESSLFQRMRWAPIEQSTGRFKTLATS